MDRRNFLKKAGAGSVIAMSGIAPGPPAPYNSNIRYDNALYPRIRGFAIHDQVLIYLAMGYKVQLYDGNTGNKLPDDIQFRGIKYHSTNNQQSSIVVLFEHSSWPPVQDWQVYELVPLQAIVEEP